MSKAARVLGLLAALQLLSTSASAQTRAGAEFQANTYTTGGAGWLAAAMLSGGGFVVVWQNPLQDGSGYGVFGQRFAVDGSRAGTEFRVNVYTTGAQQMPQVAHHGRRRVRRGLDRPWSRRSRRRRLRAPVRSRRAA